MKKKEISWIHPDYDEYMEMSAFFYESYSKVQEENSFAYLLQAAVYQTN